MSPGLNGMEASIMIRRNGAFYAYVNGPRTRFEVLGLVITSFYVTGSIVRIRA